MPEPAAATDGSALRRLRALVRSREFRFLLVGGFNTVFGLVLFVAFHALLGDQVPYLVVLTASYAVGIVVAFTTQRLFVFQVEGQVAKDLVRFVLVQLTALGTNAVLLTLLVEVVGAPVVLAQVIALGVIVVGTYFGHLFFSFHRHEEAA